MSPVGDPGSRPPVAAGPSRRRHGAASVAGGPPEPAAAAEGATTHRPSARPGAKASDGPGAKASDRLGAKASDRLGAWASHRLGARARARLGAWARGPLGWVAAGLGTTALVVLVLVAALGGGARPDREVRDAVALAAGFPAAVTVADGTVVESRALGDRAHTATVEVADPAAQDAALGLLEGGAFVRTGEVERDGVRSYSLVSADLGVTVVLKESGGVPVVTYTVAPRG